MLDSSTFTPLSYFITILFGEQLHWCIDLQRSNCAGPTSDKWAKGSSNASVNSKPTRARFLTHSNFLILPFSPFLRSPPLSLLNGGPGTGVQAPENF